MTVSNYTLRHQTSSRPGCDISIADTQFQYLLKYVVLKNTLLRGAIWLFAVQVCSKHSTMAEESYKDFINSRITVTAAKLPTISSC